MNRRQILHGVAVLVAWVGVAGVGVVMLSQAAGWNGGALTATLQSLTPYGIPVVLASAAFGVWKREDSLATVGALVALGAFALSIPLVVPPGQPAPTPESIRTSVASVNLLYSNPVVDEVADELVDLDPDVIVFSEYTPAHRDALLAHPLADRYRYQVNRDERRSSGMAVWSRYPLDAMPAGTDRTVDTEVSAPDGPIRLLGVHPPTPVFDFDLWEGELRRIGETAADSALPTLVIGDFNASYWHPAFRDLLARDLTDAHVANGSGWSTSWPSARSLPPFVRLDHALTGNGLVSTDVDDFRVPGSDHIGLIVTVAPSTPATDEPGPDASG
ncbi:MAG: endonuclease/exonuclease/phosphatase family protein [Ilumatobacter sp.]|uniref:endonuclease/exonuclease/phosphatase family protein n=1 Tax=Ilumatobacter sp. TaxID=1967498 RepID=UPI00329A19E7